MYRIWGSLTTVGLCPFLMLISSPIMKGMMMMIMLMMGHVVHCFREGGAEKRARYICATFFIWPYSTAIDALKVKASLFV